MKNFKLINPINKKELKKEYNKYVDKDGNSFLIISDIPRINKLKNYTENFGYQWNQFPETQLLKKILLMD